MSIPSRANAEAAYEPAGPPPTTRTLVYSGIDIVLCFVRVYSACGRGRSRRKNMAAQQKSQTVSPLATINTDGIPTSLLVPRRTYGGHQVDSMVRAALFESVSVGSRPHETTRFEVN